MFTKEEQEKYKRHFSLPEIGQLGQEKLKNSSVLVIGAGGLGCPALQYLATSGIGKIGIIDGDLVSVSNLQRQILFSENDIGQPKSEVAKKKLLEFNSFIEVESYNKYLTPQNALGIFKNYDVILDGSDNFGTKYLINDASIISEKPFVYGSVERFNGQVSVFNHKSGPSYRDLFSERNKEAESCSTIGVLGVVPGIIGTLQALETIKIITGIGDLLSGKLFLFDGLKMSFNVLNISKTKNSTIVSLENNYYQELSYNYSNSKEISLEEYERNKEKYTFIDVRTYEERDNENIGGEHIPLTEIPHRWMELPTNKPIVFYCETGKRSQKAIDFLKDRLTGQKLYNLKY